MIAGGRLNLDFSYNICDFEADKIEDFADKYIEKLKEILKTCVNIKTRHYTPSDFNMVNLSEEDIDALIT